MKAFFVALMCCATIAFARNSFTGGYSGAPGRQTCASSCHGGTSGTLVVTGFPSSYQPQQTYTIKVKRNGGSLIVNFNATTRLGTTTTVAGTFGTVMNTALYTGADGGVYANPHAVDSAVFQWTAPASGSGTVNFYLAGFQGTTSSSNGQSTSVVLSASEITTSVQNESAAPGTFKLWQNYPNPFNPSTTITYELPKSSLVSLKVFDAVGQEVASLVQETQSAGIHHATFDASGLGTGIYLYRIKAGNYSETKKMVLTK